MKNILLTLLIASQSTLAADLAGSYHLTAKDEIEAAFCYQGLEISIDEVESHKAQTIEKQITVHRSDIMDYPIFQALLNGQAREYRGSHGEALSSSYTTDRVVQTSSSLVLISDSVEKTFGIPVGSSKETLDLMISEETGELRVVRQIKQRAGLSFTRGTAYCTYSKK